MCRYLSITFSNFIKIFARYSFKGNNLVSVLQKNMAANKKMAVKLERKKTCACCL